AMTFETPNGLELDLRIPAGEIVIRSGDGRVTRLEIRNERNPDDFRISCDPLHAGGHRLTVDQREHKRSGWHGNDLRVEVTVPVGTDVTCQTGSADLEVTGSIGSLTFTTGSGDCRFDRVDRDVSIKTASGDLSGASTGGGFTSYSASGDANVRSVTGDVVARSASGDFSVGSVGGSLDVTTVSGDVSVASMQTGRGSVKAVSGDVEIGVARGTRVYLDLHSTSGETVSELDMSDGSAGDGPADLELQVGTVSGDVRIHRAADAASMS
ncbi:MAG: DUF4097 family beta strand repeat-containing protein, partial [Actinomycetota bacterium]